MMLYFFGGRDAKALQEKAAKKAAQDAGGNNAGSINLEAGNDVTTLDEGRDVKSQTREKHQNVYQTHPYTTKSRV
ncbi:hypothetical protein E2542_SST08997 [Spatholobus suberectus]|nr:hypothetical protein E2542_SST08997 [Spatholobus suberectus]